MAELKTKVNDNSVVEFLNSIADEKKRKDSFVVLKLMEQVTKSKPKMWGTSIVGFGSYHYKYESGHEGDAALLGFSPRKQNLVLYVLTHFKKQAELLQKLGKHKTGKVCLYINKLEDINLEILEKIIMDSWDYVKSKNQ